MSASILLLMVILMIPVYISMICIPFWTRKTESFGVSIPEEAYHRPDIKEMRKKYAFSTGFVALLNAIILIFTSNGRSEDAISILYSVMLLIFIAASFGVYLVFHKKMKQIKEQHKEWVQTPQLVMIDTGFRRKKLAYSNLWFIIPFLISILSIVITLVKYQQIPERFPMKYDLNGEVKNWGIKSYRSVLAMPIMQIYLTLLFLFINTVISKAKQQVSAANPEESIRKNIIFRRRWSLYTIFVGTGVVSLFLLPQMSIIYPIDPNLHNVVPLVFGAAVLIGSLALSISTGQGGSRVEVKGSGLKGKVVSRDDDRYWKLGMFYYNPNDPSIFLEKRFGIGWTNNWAHPLSWIIVLGIVLIAVGIPFLLG
ncbi:DUF1648 domain-containing protein [Bacillus sp. FJAT-27445]|uniref:DUF1648 domain-containing protein n=1 Tax=Bacillus sp. FJAT-27445 TaxID=1679166 RepID=UPI0007431BD9|nr:DUF5808 domain-containing protein [Bacillus sp. FJAT-27445]